MSSTPFMQLYVGDYLADTLDLTTEQHGAYLLILMTMWRHDARLPNDLGKLARIARLSPAKFKSVWAEIGRFFVVEGEMITNSRLSKEHEKASKKSEVRAQVGSEGGKAKALKDREARLANATCLPKQGQKSDIREEKREANASPKKTGSRLSPDWVLPKAWGEWAVSEGLSEADARREGEKFANYWWSVAGQKGVKLDWLATWRNWAIKAVDDRRTTIPQQKNIPVETLGTQEERAIMDEISRLRGSNSDAAHQRRGELVAQMQQLKAAGGRA